MRALVIGASGQVGKALMTVLSARGDEATGTGHSHTQPGLSALDVTDASAVRSAVAAAKPDVVFLPAGYTNVDGCETDPRCRAVNVDGCRYVAEAARSAGARFVSYSTDYVFDGTSGPSMEEDPTNPLGEYARGKLEAEQIAMSVPDTIVIRTCGVFSWDPEGLNFAMQAWRRLGNGERMRVVSDQFGTPTLAAFLARSTLSLVDRGFTGLVHITGHDWLSRLDFATRLADAFGFDAGLIDGITTAELNQKAPRPLKGGLRSNVVAGQPLQEALDELVAASRA